MALSSPLDSMRYLLFTIVALLSVASANNFGFDPGLIVDGNIELPVLALGNTGVISPDLLEIFAKGSSPNATFRQDPNSYAYLGYDGDRLVSFAHPASGETRVFPNLGSLRPFDGDKFEFERVRQLLNNGGIFPKDDTTLQLFPGATILGAAQEGNSTVDKPRAYLKHAVIQRNITAGGKSYPVCGPGSRASFGVGADGQVYSASYFWKQANYTSENVTPISRADTYKTIIQDLGNFHKNGSVQIDTVDICFYDSGEKYIQPVYRYQGHPFQDPSTNNTSSPPGFVGYVSVDPSKSPEPVPRLGDHTQSSPPFEVKPAKIDTSVVPSTSKDPAIAKRRPSLNVGRYINRADNEHWQTNSNSFLSALQRGLFGIPPQVADFVDRQYYWAEPLVYTTEKNSYVNSVHIADSEQHGGWHGFVTYGKCCESVQLSDIPADGYGPGAGGYLAYWILHSCEVIPSPEDFAPDDHKAFDPWWHIFNGLHAVLGYRTVMWIEDGDRVMPTFGWYLGLGAPVVSAWMQIVHDDYKNTGGDQLYYDKYRGIKEPMGRASAIVVCGHEGDTVVNVENIGRPGCLRQFWYGN